MVLHTHSLAAYGGLLIEVGLKLSESKCVSCLVGAIILAIHLETLVGQMHKIIIILQVVLCGARSDVAFSKDKDPEVIGKQRPNTNIKLTVLVK